MYDNIVGKIKTLAQVSFCIGAIATFFLGFATLCQGGLGILFGLVIMVAGSFGALASSWVLYGFAELIDKVGAIERNTRGGTKKSDAQSKIYFDRINKLEKLRTQGLINEEEYKEAIAKENQEEK